MIRKALYGFALLSATFGATFAIMRGDRSVAVWAVATGVWIVIAAINDQKR